MRRLSQDLERSAPDFHKPGIVNRDKAIRLDRPHGVTNLNCGDFFRVGALDTTVSITDDQIKLMSLADPLPDIALINAKVWRWGRHPLGLNIYAVIDSGLTSAVSSPI
jgi:hypothetical protein